MTFEDYVRTRIDSGAEVFVRLGTESAGSHGSLMTWDNKNSSTFFWSVKGNVVEFLGEMKSEDGE